MSAPLPQMGLDTSMRSSPFVLALGSSRFGHLEQTDGERHME